MRGDSRQPAAAEALAHTHDIRSRPSVVPLTSTEAAELKQHFEFLKQHRKLLKLRLNAQEDLLLNGAREPTDRGVCQHLLAKVELSRVAAVVERLEPSRATGLLQGIVRFSSDVGFLLLYMESVRRSSSQEEAAATLAMGLKQIDFAELSAAQLRRVLELILEVFDPATRPQILLGLLASKSFRRALDDSATLLPDALVGVVKPLRALEAAVFHGSYGSPGSEALRQGIELLLGGSARLFSRQPPQVRERLFRLGLASLRRPSSSVESGLDALLTSFKGVPTRYRELALARAAYWLAAERDDQARRLLAHLCEEYSDFHTPQRWLEALNAPRIGRVALMGKPPRSEGERPTRRFRHGFWLSRQIPVLVAVAEPEQESSYTELAQLWRGLCLPGVAPLLSVRVGDTGQDAICLVVPNLGENLAKRLAEPEELKPVLAASIVLEITLLLAALAKAGVSLPDARASRFALDEHGRAWLMDLWGAQANQGEPAARRHLEFALSLLALVRRRAPTWLLGSEIEHAILEASEISHLARALLDNWGR